MPAVVKRKRRKSPRYPAPTIRQFAVLVGTTETIIRSLVRNGQLGTVDCNGTQLVPPREEARYREMFGVGKPGSPAPAASP